MKKRSLLFLLLALLMSSLTGFAQKRVAFVYQSSYNPNRYVWGASGYDPTLDPIHKALVAKYQLTDFVYASTATPDLTTLETYDLVVLSEAIAGGSTLGNALVGLVGQVPVLNFKAYHYTSGRWGWATPANPTVKTSSVTINTGFESHPIFKGVTVTNNRVQIFDSTNVSSNMVQGFSSVVATSPIETDQIIANVTGTTTYAIHEITKLAHKYMLIPLSSDLITTVTENGVKLVINACEYLLGNLQGGGFDPDAPFKIAYLYDSSYSTYAGITKDPVFNESILGYKETTAIDIKNFTATSTDTLAALEKYDLVVVSEAISSSHKFAPLLVKLVNRVPMLNFKSFFYKSGVWSWGAGVNPSTTKNGEDGIPTIKVTKDAMNHSLFEYIDLSDSTITMFTTYQGLKKNLVQGYTVSTGSLIENDSVLATVTGPAGTFNAIHVHGKSNKYLLLPLSCDLWVNADSSSNLSANALQLISNAVLYLLQSKGTVMPAIAPTVTVEYGNGVTYVTMSTTTQGASIYYTLDGTEPTTSSTLYTGKITLTTSCTLKAIAALQGYDNSSVTSMAIVVKQAAEMPVITVASADKGKLITITASAAAKIYYTVNGATPSETYGTLYSQPFVVTRPCTVKAVAVETDKLNSTVAVLDIAIEGYVIRDSVLVWANFNDKPAEWKWANTDTTFITSGDVIAKFAYTPPTAEDPSLKPTLKTVDFHNGFMVGSYGQRINLQTTGVATTGNYSPETEADAGATDRAISFLTTNASTDPTTAYMMTTTPYQGPFDVLVWLTGAKANTYTEKLEVAVASSMDATNWTVLDTLTSIGDKKIRKRIAYYDDNAPVYVKFSSVSNLGTNSNMMIFDVKLMGHSNLGVAVQTPSVAKQAISTRYFTISGDEVKAPVYGVTIVRTTYSDGSVKTSKMLVTDRL